MLLKACLPSILENESDDLETRTDQEQIEFYARQLINWVMKQPVHWDLTVDQKKLFASLKKQMPICWSSGPMAISGIKDWFYGQTIDTVRHELNIPVLVVHL